MMNKYELPYFAEIRAKHCEPEEDIDLGERYCEICGCVLRSNEEQICDECFFESSNIRLVDGKNTDLHIDGLVFDIELGERIR